jgi:sialate O-acetylesterase
LQHDLTDGSNFGAFSAVAWYFGRELADKLNKTVPIGLVSSNIGGTAIQDWSPAEANANCNGGEPPPYPPYLPFPPQPGIVPKACPHCMGNATLWNGNIHPFSVGPMALTGILFYQGGACALVLRLHMHDAFHV